MKLPNKGNGNVTTSYMGPLDEFIRQIKVADVNSDLNPNGRSLAGLLEQLSQSDSEIGAMAEYFGNAGLFGIGKGRIRVWSTSELTEYYGESSA